MSSGQTDFHQQTQNMLAANIDVAVQTSAALKHLAPPLGRAAEMVGLGSAPGPQAALLRQRR